MKNLSGNTCRLKRDGVVFPCLDGLKRHRRNRKTYDLHRLSVEPERAKRSFDKASSTAGDVPFQDIANRHSGRQHHKGSRTPDKSRSRYCPALLQEALQPGHLWRLCPIRVSDKPEGEMVSDTQGFGAPHHGPVKGSRGRQGYTLGSGSVEYRLTGGKLPLSPVLWFSEKAERSRKDVVKQHSSRASARNHQLNQEHCIGRVVSKTDAPSFFSSPRVFLKCSRSVRFGGQEP